MANYLIILILFLLCTITVNVKGNTVKPDEVKTSEQEQGTYTASIPDGQHQSTTVLDHERAHDEQHATKQPQDKEPTYTEQTRMDSGKLEDALADQADSIASNQTIHDHSNNTHRPNFRRYIDMRKNIPITEQRIDNNWVRIRPLITPGEGHETNISRYAYFANGSRTSLRSKFDYSYDDVNWFRSTRIKIPISQFANGTTIFQYRFGPKRWIGAFRNKFFLSNNTNTTQINFSPSEIHFGERDAFFHPPAKMNRGNQYYPYSGNASYQRQMYKYGPATERGAPGMIRRRYNNRRYYDRWHNYNNYYPPYQYYDDRRWAQRNTYYDYYSYRPPYNEPRYPPNDPYYNRQGDDIYYNNIRRYGSTNIPNDPRYGAYEIEKYHHDGGYDNRRYPSGTGYVGGQYPSDGTYDSRKYQSDRMYDNQQYHPDDTYKDRKYPSESTYDDPRNRAYNTRGLDRAPNYEERRYNQGYEDKYNKRRDKRAYRESVESTGYDERPPYHEHRQRWDDRSRINQRRRSFAPDINRPHGESYEEFKWKFAFLDRNKIPEGETNRIKYFTQEYYDLLAKASKNLWKLHRDLRTILPNYEKLKDDGTITGEGYFVPIVNGSMTLLNNLARKINIRMESNITTEDMILPIDRGTYGRTLNNFDKMLDILRAYKKPEVQNEFLENFMKNLADYKKNLFIMYSDITHMGMVLQRTMKRYGLYVIKAEK